MFLDKLSRKRLCNDSVTSFLFTIRPTRMPLLCKQPLAHVTQLKSQTQQMVADIWRLVYELCSPAMDELGLLEALRAHVAQMSGNNGSSSLLQWIK